MFEDKSYLEIQDFIKNCSINIKINLELIKELETNNTVESETNISSLKEDIERFKHLKNIALCWPHC